MTVGRPPKPTELKRHAGNPGKRHLPEPVAIRATTIAPPRPPKGLATAGRALWRIVWLEGGSWLAPADAPLVAMLARNADEREAWVQQVLAEGTTYTTRSGVVRPHPGVGEIRNLEKQMATWLGLLGFTPADRARLGLAEVRRVSGLADLLDRRRQALD